MLTSARAPDHTEGTEAWRLDVLVVDPDDDARQATAELLSSLGHRVETEREGDAALARLSEHAVDLLVADVDTAGIGGFTLAAQATRLCPGAQVIICSEAPSVEDAVEASKLRADYLVKPLVSKNLLGPVAAVTRRREQRNARLTQSRRGDAIIGRSPLIKKLVRRIDQLAQTELPIAITGEPGTGKSLVAKAVHAASPHSEGLLIAVDCRRHDLEALVSKGGALDRAAGGTLVLDRFDALSSAAQVAILHYLDSEAAAARIIVTAWRSLDQLADDGEIDDDLLQLLRDNELVVPPLHSRRDDLPALVEHICHRLTGSDDLPRLAPDVWAKLAGERFPDNVRELEATIERALSNAEGNEIRLEHLAGPQSEPAPQPSDNVIPLNEAVTAFEHQYLRRALAATAGNRTRAASLLGISRKSLWAKLKRYEQRPPQPISVEWRK